MQNDIVHDLTDLRYLKWSHARNSSGTAGTFLKSQSEINNKKTYYKLSNYDNRKGIIGHECVNEIIAGRLLDILGVDHLAYTLINAVIEIGGKEENTWLCASSDFKKKGESKVALDDYLIASASRDISPYDFCVENGWREYIDRMLAFDFLILNRDRHGANIEVLRNSRERTLRIAPLFDHGLSLLCSCRSPDQIEAFDVTADRRCNNYIGSQSCLENLDYIRDKKNLFDGRLTENDKDFLFEGINRILCEKHIEKIWEMVYGRWKYFESLWDL